MREGVSQGEILKIERINKPVFVASKDFFNETGEIIGCPIYKESTKSPLHIYISTNNAEGYVQCEKVVLLDLNVRGYKIIDRVAIKEIMEITDTIQGIFDYI